MQIDTVFWTLRARTGQLRRDLGTAQAELRTAGRQAGEVFGRQTAIGLETARRSVQRAALAFSGGAAVAAGLAAKAAIDFETAMAGVRKTVDASEGEIQQLASEFTALSEEIPVGREELARLGQVAGQLGIAVPNIARFVETTAKLGAAVDDLSPEQAATELARFANVAGTSQDNFENLASALVQLGNTTAATEGEILNFAQRIVAIGREIGLTEGEIFGLAASLTALGVEAEAGGTALQRTFLAIQDAVRTGGEDLEEFARIAGGSAATFQQLFAEAPAQAIQQFLEGINRANAAGQSLTGVLDRIGLANQRTITALLGAARAVDQLEGNMESGNRAFEEGTALADEAAKRFDTTASALKILRNTVNNVAGEFAVAFLPVIREVAVILTAFSRNVLRPLAELFQALPAPARTAVAALLTIGTAAPVIVLVTRKLQGLRDAILTVNAAAGAGSVGGIGRLAALLGRGGPVIIGLTLAAVGVTAFARELRDALGPIRGINDELETTAQRLRFLERDISGLSAEALARFAESVRRQVGNLDQQAAALNVLIDAARRTGSAFVKLPGSMGGANVSLERARELANATTGEAEGLRRKLDEVGRAAETAGEGVSDATGDLDDFIPSLEEAAAALGVTIDRLEALGDLVRGPLIPDLDRLFVDPLVRAAEAVSSGLERALGPIEERLNLQPLRDDTGRLRREMVDLRAEVERLTAPGQAMDQARKSLLELSLALRVAGVEVEDLPPHLQEAVKELEEFVTGKKGVVDLRAEFQKFAGDLVQVTSLVFELADALGFAGDEAGRASRALQGLVGGAVAGASLFPQAPFVGLVAGGLLGGLAGLFGGGGGADIAAEDLRKTVEENTAALRELTSNLGEFSRILREFTSREIRGLRELTGFDLGFAAQGNTEVIRNLGLLRDLLESFGLTAGDLERIARAANIEIDILAKLLRDLPIDPATESLAEAAEQFRALQEAISRASFERFLETFAGQMEILAARFRIFDIEDPVKQLEALLAVAERFAPGIFAGIDPSTPEGRRALEEALRKAFEAGLEGNFPDDLTFDQFLQLLGQIDDTLDDVAESAGETRSFTVARAITEVTGNRMVGVLTTISIIAQLMLAELQSIREAVGGIAPTGAAIVSFRAPAADVEVLGIEQLQLEVQRQQLAELEAILAAIQGGFGAEPPGEIEPPSSQELRDFQLQPGFAVGDTNLDFEIHLTLNTTGGVDAADAEALAEQVVFRVDRLMGERKIREDRLSGVRRTR